MINISRKLLPTGSNSIVGLFSFPRAETDGELWSSRQVKSTKAKLCITYDLVREDCNNVISNSLILGNKKAAEYIKSNPW